MIYSPEFEGIKMVELHQIKNPPIWASLIGLAGMLLVPVTFIRRHLSDRDPQGSNL